MLPRLGWVLGRGAVGGAALGLLPSLAIGLFVSALSDAQDDPSGRGDGLVLAGAVLAGCAAWGVVTAALSTGAAVLADRLGLHPLPIGVVVAAGVAAAPALVLVVGSFTGWATGVLGASIVGSAIAGVYAALVAAAVLRRADFRWQESLG